MTLATWIDDAGIVHYVASSIPDVDPDGKVTLWVFTCCGRQTNVHLDEVERHTTCVSCAANDRVVMTVDQILKIQNVFERFENAPATTK